MNTNAKHSPGPWKYARAFQNNGPNYYVISTGKWKSPAIATAEKEEDARLMAKAPDMFSAIQDIISSAQANDANSLAEAINAAERVINA